MLKKHQITAFTTALIATVALAGAGAVFAGSSGPQAKMSKTAGDYTITLLLLPAEHFVKKSAAGEKANAGKMVIGGGKAPVRKASDKNPNHHLVAVVKKDNKTVKDADVTLTYQKAGSDSAEKTDLPVVRMWHAGKGKKTTHYGNNLKLDAGKYKVHVTVNGKANADFDLTVK